jgi:nicotinate (nicotinamide) nucleotide adenylyltransferase
MVQLAIKDQKRFGDIILEERRYTVADTLPQLKARFKGAELYMLIGDDLLARLSDWPNVEDLLLNMHFIIGIRKSSRQEVLRRLKVLQNTRGFAVQFELLDSPLPGYSSSNIRRALKSGHTPKGLIGPVEDYIEANGLYAAVSSDKS